MTTIKRLFLNRLIEKTLLSVFVLSIVFCFVPLKVSAAITVIIAASDSSNEWKSQATAICDGTADQSEINAYLTAGNTVELAPGNFQCNGWILPQANSHLIGQGNDSIINLSDTGIQVLNVNNFELGHFKLTGTAWQGGAVFLAVDEEVKSGFQVHDIWCTAKGGNAFVVYANSGRITDISFVRCDADNPDGFGFLINGEGAVPVVEDITFYKCSVENAGVAASRTSDWVTGFDFAEYPGLTLNRMQAIDCSVNGAWESDYHFESDPTKIGCIITDCTATNAGIKTEGALYGAGYLVDGSSDTILFDNTGSSNEIADIRAWNGSSFVNITPATNEIYPVSSSKITTDVSQSNCDGVIVFSGNYLNLYLYSSDDNPVNQQVELGNYYQAADGRVYIFNGTKIVAQFTDYIIIRLVRPTATTMSSATTTPTATTNLPTTITATLTTINTQPTTSVPTTNVEPKVKQFLFLPIFLETTLAIIVLLLLFGSGWFKFTAINRDGTLNRNLIIFFLLSLLVTLSIMAIIISNSFK